MLVNHILEKTVEKYPDKDAVWFDKKWKTYREIDGNANKIANKLLSLGIKRGDRVTLIFKNSFDYIQSFFGVLKAGGVAVPLNTENKGSNILYLLDNSDSVACLSGGPVTRHVIPAIKKSKNVKHYIHQGNSIKSYDIDNVTLHSLGEIYAKGNPEKPEINTIDLDLAAIIYTSGSTGIPKGVMLSHLNLVSNMRSITEYLHLTQEDRILVILPFFYIYGKSLLLTHFLCGGQVVIDNNFVYPNKVIETMEKMETTGFAGVPSTFTILLNRSILRTREFPKLRYVTQAGGAMPVSVQKEAYKVFSPADLYIMYGATEAAPRLTYLEPQMLSKKWGSIGKAVPNVEVLVADPQSNPVEPETEGEIMARGSNIMKGYWKDPEGTKQVLKNGYYYTGDLGKIDSEGFLYVTGRSKDIIKVKGFRVSAKEIEEAIMEMEEVEETAVVGIPDEILGEAVKAFIVFKEGMNIRKEEIINSLKGNLVLYKIPKEIVIMGSLPKNKSGKIMKPLLAKKTKNQE